MPGIGQLADRGLVVNSRVLSIEQRIADIEGKVLDLDTAALRAKQDINKATQDASNLANDRDREIAEARQQVEKDIVELSLKVDTYRSLMAEALAKAPDIAARAADGTRARRHLLHRARRWQRDEGDPGRRDHADPAGRRRQGDAAADGVHQLMAGQCARRRFLAAVASVLACSASARTSEFS